MDPVVQQFSVYAAEYPGKKDPEHIKAQEQGRTQWYESYSVEVCKVERSYAGAEPPAGM